MDDIAAPTDVLEVPDEILNEGDGFNSTAVEVSREECDADSDNGREVGDAEGEDAEDEIEEILTEKEKEDRIARAVELKSDGNKLYAAEDYSRAIAIYGEGLDVCPKGLPERAPLYANRAACYLKLEQFEDCAVDCSDALEIQPIYPKVSLRRAIACEKLERYDEALEDCKEVLKHEPNNQMARDGLKRLPPLLEAHREKMKNEMLGNLKKLGNMCLRPFGLSTENFQMVQDPSTGSYSVNFQQNTNG